MKKTDRGTKYLKPYIPQNIGKNKPEGEAPPGMVCQQSMDTGTMQNPHDAFQQEEEE